MRSERAPVTSVTSVAAFPLRPSKRLANHSLAGRINADQAKKIRALIESPTDETRLLKVLKVSSVEEIRNFDRVISILEQRRRSKEDPPS
jgi:hypothetical protein